MPKHLIQVTAERIALAQRANSNHCMIADAIRDSIPDARWISVDMATIRYTDVKLGLRFVFLTSRPCQQQLVRFDQGVEVLPWSFRLPRPSQIVPMKGSDRESLRDGDSGVAMKRPRRRKTLTMVRTNGEGTQAPIVIGGPSPPKSKSLATPGTSRVFGMKGLQGFNPFEPE